MGLSCYAFKAIKISLSALLWHTKRREDAALATSPCAYLSSVPAFKTSNLTHRPALSQAGETLSLAAAEVFQDCHLHLKQPCRAHLDQHLREHFWEQMPARGMGALTSSSRVPWWGELKKLGSMVSPFQNKTQLIPAWSWWDWQDMAKLLILQALDLLPTPINVQLSQTTACTY